MSEIDCDAAAEATGYEYAMDCLKEEMEVLRKNARRYEFVRAYMGVGFSVSNGFCIYVTNKYYEELAKRLTLQWVQINDPYRIGSRAFAPG